MRWLPSWNDRRRLATSSRQMSTPDRASERVGCELGRNRGFSVALAGYSRQPVMVLDPAIESHYGTGYERSRLFPGGNASLEFVRSMELLGRLLPRPPARL